jgi:hypothetical protein
VRAPRARPEPRAAATGQNHGSKIDLVFHSNNHPTRQRQRLPIEERIKLAVGLPAASTATPARPFAARLIAKLTEALDYRAFRARPPRAPKPRAARSTRTASGRLPNPATTAVPQLLYPGPQPPSGFFTNRGPHRQVFVCGVEVKATL